jgi:hypothetical protein
MREVLARAHGVKLLKTKGKLVRALFFVRARRTAAESRPLPAMSCAPVRAESFRGARACSRAESFAGVRACSRARGGALAAPAPPALLSRFLDGKGKARLREAIGPGFGAIMQGARAGGHG